MQIDKTHPIMTLLKNAGYRKTYAFLRVVPDGEKNMYRAPYWDGGCKDEYFFLNPKTGAMMPDRLQFPAASWPSISQVEYENVAGRMLVTGGIFCGKPRSWSVVICESDYRKLMGEGDES